MSKKAEREASRAGLEDCQKDFDLTPSETEPLAVLGVAVGDAAFRKDRSNSKDRLFWVWPGPVGGKAEAL